MADSAVLLLFCEGYEAEDLAIHEDLIRSYETEAGLHSFVLLTPADLDAVRACAQGYEQVVVWNNYWPVDEISAALAREFAGRLVGSHPDITRHTTLKSTTYQRLSQSGIACPWYALVSTADEVAGLKDIPFPVMVKPDAGYDTVDMAASSRCEDLPALRAEVARLAAAGHEGIVVQQFLLGREFTVAFANHRAFCPIEKIYPQGRSFYLSGAPYEKRPCQEAELGPAVRELAKRAAWAFGLGRTDYCRIDIRQDDAGRLFVIDVNDMCSVYPKGQFEASMAADGLPRSALAGWLTAQLRLERFARQTHFYFAFHKDFSQVENLVPFLRRFRCTVLLYAWADGAETMAAWFRRFPGVEVDWFSVASLSRYLAHETGDAILVLTETPGYDIYPAQREFFALVRQHFPCVRDVLSIGHCLAHSSCDSCGSDVGDIPIKYTAHKLGLLPFDAEELRRTYAIDERTVLVSPTTGDDHILLARHDLLAEMRAMQDEGRVRFLFKLHPSTEMMAFDGVWFQLEQAGYDYVCRHFQRVAPEHFSVFAFTGLVRRHITDLYSSLPAMLTAFAGLDILVLENPAVPTDHALRPHIRVFDSPAELRAALADDAPPPQRPTQDFWRGRYPPVTGAEVLSVALDRGWLEPVPARPGTCDPEAFRRQIADLVADTRQRHALGEADDDTLESVIYYFEQPLNQDHCTNAI